MYGVYYTYCTRVLTSIKTRMINHETPRGQVGPLYTGGRINFLRRKSSDLFGELFSERNSFIEDGSNYSFYEEISLDLK